MSDTDSVPVSGETAGQPITRRTVLAAGASVGTVAVSGCLGVFGPSGPTAPVRLYLEAIQAGDQEQAEAQLHPNASMSPTVDESGQTMNIQTVEEATPEDYVNDVEQLDSPDRVRNTMGSRVEENTDAADWTLVYASWESEGFNPDRYFIVVKEDGEWLLFS